MATESEGAGAAASWAPCKRRTSGRPRAAAAVGGTKRGQRGLSVQLCVRGMALAWRGACCPVRGQASAAWRTAICNVM